MTGERDQASVTLVARLLEASLLNLAVDRFPLRAELRRPVLTGLGLSLQFFGDRFPGVANDTTFGGKREQSFPVVAHGEPREVGLKRFDVGLK
jgi:hypothetical protein